MAVSTESLLPDTWRKEDFSYAYAVAIAAAAGVSWTIPRRDINSCDVEFEARDDAVEDAPKLKAQLKCTADGLTTTAGAPDEWHFSIKEANYSHLRHPRTHPPRILVVVRCPADFEDWVTVSPSELLLRAEAWWVSLKNQPELADGQQNVTVAIPKRNIFDVSSLLENMCSCP